MPKPKRETVQVRIPTDLNDDLLIVAPTAGKSLTEYVEDVLRTAVARDMPHAAKVAAQRAEALKKRRPASPAAEGE